MDTWQGLSGWEMQKKPGNINKSNLNHEVHQYILFCLVCKGQKCNCVSIVQHRGLIPSNIISINFMYFYRELCSTFNPGELLKTKVAPQKSTKSNTGWQRGSGKYDMKP